MSINFHPHTDLLLNYAGGNLEPAYRSVIEVHTSFCAGCADVVEQFEQLGGNVLLNAQPISVDTSLAELMDKIEAESAELTAESVNKTVSIVEAEQNSQPKTVKDILSYAKLSSVKNKRWIPITKSISDIRVDISDRNYNAHLIQIKAGTHVPMHTHHGEEVTVVLKGSFRDDFGTYKAGDFIIRDASHRHKPYAETDCVCYAITNEPLHYTGFFGPLINWFNARFEKKYYGDQVSA